MTKSEHPDSTGEKPSVTLAGKVEKIIPAAPRVQEPEKAQISVERADHLYREIRVENVLHDENGKELRLKEGAHVDVTIQADPQELKKDSKDDQHGTSRQG
jgi:hypothetical protein